MTTNNEYLISECPLEAIESAIESFKNKELSEWELHLITRRVNTLKEATTEANKRMVDSEREIANLKLNIAAQEQLGYELQASNNRLRDGIAEIAVEAQDTYTNAALTKLLSATPAESLQAHDDELLERAEKAADSARWAGTDVVLAIRALKEVTK